MTVDDEALTLVTGFPRLVAKLIARELVEAGDGPVALLVRGRYLDDARRFVDSLGAGGRVTLVEGDVTSIDMGLSGREYLSLARRVALVHHAAQSTYEGADAAKVRRLNVQGTHEVIEFARAAGELGRAPRVVACSSTLVAGDHEGLVREEELEYGQAFRSEVERTLHLAERMLRRASPEVPVTIARPSIVVGHSQTGEVDVFDGPYLFVLLLLSSPVDITLPLPARGEIPLNLVPVDYVARASVALGRNPAAAGRTVHLVDPYPLPSRRVFERVARAAGRRMRRGVLPPNLTRALLRTPGVERFARSPRAFVERMATRAVYPADGARELLEPAGVTCPPFDRYADALVEHVRRRLASRRSRPDAIAPEPEVDDPLA